MTSEAFAVLATPGHSAEKTRLALMLLRRAERAVEADAAEPLRATLRRAARTIGRILAQAGGELAHATGPAEIDEALVQLELFVASCRTVLAGVLDVRNFERPAAHALFSLVEGSVLTHAVRDLKAMSPGPGEPRRHEVDHVLSFERHLHLDDAARRACSIVLALGQRPVERLAELVGFAYAGTFVLALLSRAWNRPRYESALRRIEHALDGVDRERAARGVRLFALCAQALASASAPSAAQRAGRVIRMLEHKARYAMLHHRDEALGDRRLVEWFSDKPFQARAMLDALYRSPWIDRDDVAQSRFFQSLTARGGKMFGVFSPAELALLQQYLLDQAQGTVDATQPVVPKLDDDRDELRDTPAGSLDVAAHDYRGRYFALLDAEQYPDAVRVATEAVEETFSELAALRKLNAGPPLFEPFHYYREAVETRMSAIYAYQAERVHGLRPLDAPELRKFHVCFAPLGLIDGCWLRSVVADRAGDAHLLLYGVYSDEIGNGELAHNHANLYGQLLAELGSPITTLGDLAQQRAGVPNRAFKAPAFLLALDRVHAAHFPELLGVTLAIEMSGLDGLYERMIANLEARSYSAAYWRLHVSVDNFSTGHARQSLDAVIAYMEDAIASCGAVTAAALWDRIWRGFLVMLYLFEIELKVLIGATTGGRA